MKKWLSLMGAVLALMGTWNAASSEPQIDTNAVTIVHADQMQWQEYPGLPGEKLVVLYGDPKKEGVYVIRAKFAPHTMSRPHWHPEARYVTVISGTWWGGTGDSFDPDRTVALKAGSFAVHTPGEVHYDGARDEEAVVQIIGVGPSGTNVVPVGASNQ
jgi:quercetin dioxygenase-like cupin family protein